MSDFSKYPEALRDVLETFRDNPTDRNPMLIDYSDQFVDVPAHVATRPFPEENHVPHCESESYVFAEKVGEQDGVPLLNFYYAVENPFGVSARALSAVLTQTINGTPANIIANMPIEDIVPTLFSKNISMGKGQGLMGIAAYTKAFAQRYAKKD